MGGSRQAVMTANVLSLFQIPNLGIWATSDELSDKSRYEYFLRLVPPDSFQVLHYSLTRIDLLSSKG